MTAREGAPWRALIVDDEALARALVREFLAPHRDIELAGEAADGLEAVRQIGALAPDLVFLDVQMPRLTGLEVLELTGLRRGVVFTTAHEAHALAAFELHAVDYLLKPFTQARFDAALERARRLRGMPADAGLEALVSRRGEPISRILVREREQVHVIAVDTVEYIEAQGDNLAVVAQGQTHLKPQRISDIEEQLDPRRFVRVHRSFIINLDFLRAIERPGADRHVARLAGGKRVPISRAGYEKLRERV